MRILKLAVAAVCAALVELCSAAHAADLPMQFHGFWVGSSVPNKDECGKLKDVDSDSTMSVAGGTITYYEGRCQVQSAKRQEPPDPKETVRINLDVRLACEYGNSRWSERQIWHFETIGGKKVLAVTSLSVTNFRDEGREVKSPNRIHTVINFACD
jgi:hypothetical protein